MGLEQTVYNAAEKMRELRQAGIDPYPENTPDHISIRQVLHSFEEGGIDGEVGVVGRLTAKRGHGKVSFGDLEDGTGRIQLYLRFDVIGQEGLDLFSRLDLGDWVWAHGGVVRTKRGEISVSVTRLMLLSKILRPYPDKWKGLKDQESRYRQRYVDLMISPGARAVFAKRAEIIRSLRRTLERRGFLEVETPILQPIYGGAAARPFETYHNVHERELYLRIALELPLKKLLVGGMGRVFEIGRCFRNEGMDRLHNPEFTLLEAYEAFSDMHGMMELAEDLVRSAASDMSKGSTITYQGTLIDLREPFEQRIMSELLREHAGFDAFSADDDLLHEACLRAGVEELPLKPGRVWLIDKLFSLLVEPLLVQPTFVVGYPLGTSPLARASSKDAQMAARFELYVAGREIVNAYSELNDPIEQRDRLEKQRDVTVDDDRHPVDEGFLTALEYGMPPAGGLGLGVDRLVMLLTDTASIQDVLLFPQMRPIGRNTEHIDGPREGE
jgi:lysyl-tRNA synthetase class 2